MNNKKFDADEIYRNLAVCHVDGIILCRVRNQPDDCPPHCQKLQGSTPKKEEK